MEALAAGIEAELRAGNYRDTRGQWPYVEVDGSYVGVRIRRITHLGEGRIDALQKLADALYLEYAAKFGRKIPATGDWCVRSR